MRYYLIAGEASGDLHGSNLIRELRHLSPKSAFRAWGGDEMEAAGAVVVKHFRDLAFMGFAEVIANLGTIMRNLSFCKKDILHYNPDALILIDYPGFNLRIAAWAHQKGFRVIYYISPQVWAWKENRVRAMKQCIDKMLVILPFEKKYYQEKWQWNVDYVGHPLVEVVSKAIQQEDQWPHHAAPEATKKIIAILPGSRRQEIIKKLPVMLRVSRQFPGYQFIVAKAPGIPDEFYEALLVPFPGVTTVRLQTYALLKRATAALVTSGTATLETALFGVPQVVCYKGNPISYQIARRILTIKYISLVNLIMDQPIVRELIQQEFNEGNLEQALKEILLDETRRATIGESYRQLKELLVQGGHASRNAAVQITTFLQGTVKTTNESA